MTDLITMAARLETIAGHLTGRTSSSLITPQPTSSGSFVPLSDTFSYTVDSPLLSNEQRRFYEEHGFLVVRKLVPKVKLDRYRKRFEQICKEKLSVPGMTVMKDVANEASEFIPGEKAVSKLQDFQNDDGLFEYCSLPEVVKYAEGIIGSDLVAIHTMLINKPPDSGKLTSRHPMHQDLHYFPFRPSERIVCSWTAMQTVNRQNGCLVVVPGTHKGHLLPHVYPNWEGGVNKMYHGIQDFDPSQKRVYLEMEEGDTVFFHPILIHGSGTNKSQGFRKSISCHYASGKCYTENTMDIQQQEIMDEVRQVAEKKLGEAAKDIKFEYLDIWKLKSRVVKGNGFD